jgi:beta-lactamase regulating signal transducer with metallopeptidase domain
MAHLVLINGTLNKVITAFSWMLIHSLWQGLFLAIIAGAALVLAKKSSAAYRYNLALVLFLAFIAACGFTFVYEWQTAATTSALIPLSVQNDVKAAPLFIDVHTVKQLVNSFTAYFSANAPLIMMVWFMVFLFKSIRMISCLAYNQRIRNYQVYEPSEYWMDKIAMYSEKLGIKKTVKLLQSGYVKVPVVVGHLKPVVLLPVGLLAGLPAEQVEAILLHELAHIRRNDYVVNFLQIIAEAVFFFNPGLLWISSVLKEERENCCDDVALQQTNDKIGFVQALISFKEHQLYGGAYATAFPGKKNYLMRRVVRILSNDNKMFGRGEKVFFITSILLFGMLVATAAVARIKESINTPVRKEIPAVSAALPMPMETAVVKIRTAKKRYHYNLLARTKTLNDIVSADELKARQDVVNLQISRRELANATANLTRLQNNDASVRTEEQRKQLDAAKVQADRDRRQAELDRQQADRDRQQADLDRQQAERDRAQAEKDRHQAELDRQQADRDRQQADKDRAQAERERQQNDAKNRTSAQE